MNKTELMGRLRRRHQCQVRCATADFDLTSNMETTIPRMPQIALRKLGHPLGYGEARQKNEKGRSDFVAAGCDVPKERLRINTKQG